MLYLDHQYRQTQGELLDILTALRQGDIRRRHAEALLSRIDEQPPTDKITELHTMNLDVDAINDGRLRQIDDDERRRMRDGEIAHIVFKYIRQENNMRKFHGRELLTLAEEGNIASAAKVLFSGLKERINVMNNFSYTVNSFAAGYYETGKLVD